MADPMKIRATVMGDKVVVKVLMAHEMETGARYVASLMPAPIESPLKIDWRFIPSAELGER